LRTTRVLIVAALGLTAVAATAKPALASGFTLELSAPPAVVGKPIVLKATGTIPVDALGYSYWFSLDAIPTSVTTTCPPDHFQGSQFALATGGSVIVFTQREAADAAGRFTIPVAITPTSPGSVLLCGYTDDGYTNTLAQASLLLNVAPASAPAARRPSPPVQLTHDIRGCRALLGGAGGRRCVRAAVRRARAGCLRYGSQRRQVRCLGKVRRVARAAR
jgi:hypothetical protein